MTKQEFFNLSKSYLYEFNLYYGPTFVGFLVERDSNYYIITPPHRNAYNTNAKPISEIGIKVLLSSISTHRIYEEGQVKNEIPTLRFSGEKVKKLIILGAGASYDFSFDINAVPIASRPPLAKDLFAKPYSDIINKYPGAFNLSSEILLADDIEEYFQLQWHKITTTTNPVLFENLINVQFYLHELFDYISNHNFGIRENNYSSLAKQAFEYSINTGEHVAFVSFNYDTLIEESLTKQARIHFNSLNDYVDYQNRNILLFKPHGSWNWIKKAKQHIQINLSRARRFSEIYQFAEHFYNSRTPYRDFIDSFEDNISIYTKVKNVAPTNSHTEISFYPQLLIPYKEKDDFIMPSLHKNCMDHLLSEVEDILIIGWKGSEKKFQQFLHDKLSGKKLNITIVNADSGDSIKDLFNPISLNSSFHTHRTFSEYIKNINDPKNQEHFFTVKSN